MAAGNDGVAERAAGHGDLVGERHPQTQRCRPPPARRRQAPPGSIAADVKPDVNADQNIGATVRVYRTLNCRAESWVPESLRNSF